MNWHDAFPGLCCFIGFWMGYCFARRQHIKQVREKILGPLQQMNIEHAEFTMPEGTPETLDLSKGWGKPKPLQARICYDSGYGIADTPPFCPLCDSSLKRRWFFFKSKKCINPTCANFGGSNRSRKE